MEKDEREREKVWAMEWEKDVEWEQEKEQA